MKAFFLRLLLRPVPRELCFLVICSLGGCLIAMYATVFGVTTWFAPRQTYSVTVRVQSIIPLPHAEEPFERPRVKLPLLGPLAGMRPETVVYEVLRLRAQGGCLEWQRATSGFVEFVPGLSEQIPRALLEQQSVSSWEKRNSYALFSLDRPELMSEANAVGYRSLQCLWTVTGVLATPGGISVTRSSVHRQEERHLRRTRRARVTFCEEP